MICILQFYNTKQIPYTAPVLFVDSYAVIAICRPNKRLGSSCVLSFASESPLQAVEW